MDAARRYNQSSSDFSINNVNDFAEQPSPSRSRVSRTDSGPLKFAQILGFSPSSSGAPPVNMGTFARNEDNFTDSSSVSLSATENLNNSSVESFIVNSNNLDSTFNSHMGFEIVSQQWAMNYQEAAIYLEEGRNNDQFSTHPKRKESLPAYLLAHRSWFHLIDLGASLILLILAFFEKPAVYPLHVFLHASFEIGALVIISFGLFLKLRWIGYKSIFKHDRTLMKAITLFVMIIEAITVIVRQSSHFRVTRALRPIFVVDNRYCRGIRRFTREVLQSLPPIIDMLILLFFFILIFTLLGHFLFGHVKNNPFFETLEQSFINLFVLLTTANYPDVMMPAYNNNRWSVLFFVAYLVTVLYLFMNLLLAVVYDTFTTLEKEKFRKLVIHKRKACHFAFNLLVSRLHPKGVTFRHFYGMMAQYQQNKSLRDIYLTFRAMKKDPNVEKNSPLTREEFCRFYEFSILKWKPLKNEDEFQNKDWLYFKEIGVLSKKFLNSIISEHIFNTIIVLNTASMVARWIEKQNNQVTWDSYIFSILFVIEMAFKLITWGPPLFFTSGWRAFDLLATVIFFYSLIIAQFVPSMNELLTFVRPLRLLRLFKMKKRYRDVFGTLFILIPPMSSVGLVIILLYYFYSIIGMEVFANTNLKDCCNGTLIEDYFTDSNDTLSLRFYLNTFSNLISSYVTLFELTVVNNWYIIMEAHVNVTNRFTRLYFMSFYIVMMIVITIIVAFILDTFLFRIEYKKQMDHKSEEKMLRTEVSLSEEELEFCYRHNEKDRRKKYELLQDDGYDLAERGLISFVGVRKRTKEILFKRLFKNEIPTWLNEMNESEPILQIHH